MHNSRGEVEVVADHSAFANVAARSDVSALADNRASLDHHVGINADGESQLGRLVDDCGLVNAGSVRSRRMQKNGRARKR